MARMSPERWLAAAPHLDRALELAPADRESFLGQLRARDSALADDVERLLAAHGSLDRESFLEGPLSPPPAPASLAGQTLGAYELVSLIGQGGMGTVWLAHRSDGRFEGHAAVKLLNASLVGRAGEERFRREGSILARLAHPHIARLLDAGVSPGGQPYIVLEHIEGLPIDRYCDGANLDVQNRVRLFLDVLGAVAHAHMNLIVHRDIKPSNVLVTPDGRAMLFDFGIAKLLEAGAGTGEATALTREGGAALTPAYASPEQITGGPITTATDIYALGALLYLLLSGKHPAGDTLDSPAEVVRSIVDTEPRRLSDAAPSDELRRKLKGDLETIVGKAIKKKPEERYASVTAFAEDLRRFLDDEPISARPDALAYRTAKFVRRNRAAVSLSSLAVLALAAGLAGTYAQARRASRHAALAEGQRRRADQEARAAGEQRDFALRQLSLAESVLDLDSAILAGAPAGKSVTADELLASAERIAERQHASEDENHVVTLLAIGHHYLTQNENASARRVISHAYDVASALSDRPLQARAGCELAGVLVYDGETERAEDLIRSGDAAIPREPRYITYRLRCLLCGSDVARWRGDTAAGVERAEEARRLLAASPIADPVLEKDIAMSLAESYRIAGRMRDASHAAADAVARLKDLGRDETVTAATLYNNWGLVELALGRPLEAERLLRQAVRIENAGGKAAGVRPMVLNNLARTLRELHRLDEAAADAESAYARADRLGDRNVVGQALMARAGIYRERGDIARAQAAVSDLAASLPRMVPPGHAAFASLAMEQALLAAARQDLEAALSLANRSVAIADASKQRIDYLPRLLLRRSEIELAMHRTAAARSDAEQALAMSRGVPEPGTPSAAVGRAQLALGRILAEEGSAGDSRAAFAAALEQLRPTLGEDHPETREAARRSADARS